MAHGKGSRTRARQKRLKEKRARKAANKALYAVRIANGTNSKRARIRAKRVRHHVRRQKMHPCGNIGCRTCEPFLNTMNGWA